jgi:hypothetical protein
MAHALVHAASSAMLQASGRVAAEFMGRARDLRRRIEAEDDLIVPLMNAAAVKIKERLKRHPIAREAQIVDLVRCWQRLPSAGRLCPLYVARERHGVALIDNRAHAITLKHPDWGEDASEPALAIVIQSAFVEPCAYERMSVLRAHVGLHGLSRLYERMHPRCTDADARAALLLLARSEPEGEPGTEFRVPVPELGGEWRGTVECDAEGRSVFAARTWKEIAA